MKKTILVILGSCLALFLLSIHKNEKNSIDLITENYLQRYASLKESINELELAIIDNKPKQEIQKSYLKLRKYYKQWEYLAIQKDPVFIKEEINAAPLPKIEENSFGSNIIAARGLQQLDDLIFSDEYTKEEITQQVTYLKNKFKEYTPIKLYDRDVFEGARIELIRLFTLGLTGYDTPGSANAIQDATDVLITLQEDLNIYHKTIIAKDSALAKHIQSDLLQAINYLKQNNNFEKLDRFYFIKNYLNPLYKNILWAHRKLEIELPEEVYQQKLAFNYNSENLFAEDFINSSYYIQVPDKFNTNKTKELGKLLFFDPILSSNNDRACASCHNPDKAFTDQLPKSIASGKIGFLKRNSPTLINSVYTERLFHDMRARTFVDQMEHVLTSKDEFNSSMIELLEKLNQSEEYINLFKSAFELKENKISGVYIQMALSVYVASLTGMDSQFDKYIRGETTKINKDVIHGFNIFMGKAVCGTCHFAPIFNGTVPPDYKDSESEVLGVPENPYVKKPKIDTDEGRGAALLKEKVFYNQYAFKTPTVRNSKLTFPYMHNGSYKNLEDVMDFYNKGGGKGIGIVLEHQTLPFDELKLTNKEMKDVIAFMNALTDTSGITTKPNILPKFKNQPNWNKRKIGGEY